MAGVLRRRPNISKQNALGNVIDIQPTPPKLLLARKVTRKKFRKWVSNIVEGSATSSFEVRIIPIKTPSAAHTVCDVRRNRLASEVAAAPWWRRKRR
jgi:hypothetical protein